jgi:hypothetical protein
VAKTAEQVLRGAAQYIREHGWRRRYYGTHGGPRCMLGALMSASAPDRFYGLRVAGTLMPVTGGSSPAEFNDVHCKTANDAIAALEIAADLAA